MESLSQWSGYFCQSGHCGLWIIASIFILLFLGFFSMPLIVWAVAGLVLLFGFGAPSGLFIGFAVVMLVFLAKPIRTVLVSN
ncbi:MAG: hypothetical protein K2P92_02115, partial [Bdellovibrionaceae bacterium]|nr:hypothetical protein [Pseudobdellovibrionaceae bacterium]